MARHAAGQAREGCNPFRAAFFRAIVLAVESKTTFPVLIQVDPVTLKALDAWRDEQPEPKPSRAEAAAYLVRDGLIGMGLRNVKA